VRASIPPTPQIAWPLLKGQTEVVVKHEPHADWRFQGTRRDRLKRERPQVQGIVTATRGKHGHRWPSPARCAKPI